MRLLAESGIRQFLDIGTGLPDVPAGTAQDLWGIAAAGKKVR